MTLVLIGLVGGIITGLSPCVLPVLAGTWTIGQESITAGQGAGITLAFHASKVYLDVGVLARSPSRPAARAWSSASSVPLTLTPSPPSSPQGTAP